MKKKINCYIEIETEPGKFPVTPTVWYDKPSKSRLEDAKKFGFKYYKGVIKVGKEIK